MFTLVVVSILALAFGVWIANIFIDRDMDRDAYWRQKRRDK